MKITEKEFSIQSMMAPEIVFQSPLKVTVKWEDYFQASKIIRYMTLHKGSDQINFEMEVDWQSHNKLLKVVFPTSIEVGKAFYEQSYGYVKRKDSELDFPAQKWIDYTNERVGVALLI